MTSAERATKRPAATSMRLTAPATGTVPQRKDTMSTRTSRARLAVSGVITAGLCLAGTATLAAPSHADSGQL